jgi:hypothetical protein
MTPLVQLLIQESPMLVGLIQSAFKKANPGAPVPTSEEVIAGYEQLFQDDILKDHLREAVLQAEIDKAKGGT